MLVRIILAEIISNSN